MFRPKIKISPFKQLCFFKFQLLEWHFTTAWNFATSKSRLKLEKIQERCLRLQLNNCINWYETLLTKSGNYTLEVNRLCIFATEICETLNG